jgi:hypothetical protein
MNKAAKVDLKTVQEIMGDRTYTGKELCAMFGFSLKTNIFDTRLSRYLEEVDQCPKRYKVKV